MLPTIIHYQKETSMNTESSKLSYLEKLKKQEQLLKARIQKAESRHKEQERKDDTRRKILLGALCLDKLRHDSNFAFINDELNTFLTKNNDRKLFGLPLLNDELAS